MTLRITPARARKIEEAIRALKIVKSTNPDEPSVEEYYKQVASDMLEDLYDDWKQLQADQVVEP